jgi:hypothetical protein
MAASLKGASVERAAFRQLASWLEQPRAVLEPSRDGIDFVLESEHGLLVVECKTSGNASAVKSAIDEASTYAARIRRKATPVVAVPFMGELGKRLCADGGVSWFDLSGNAHVVAPGLRILIEGKPNRFVRRGRPSTAFAPKSARIARRLLIEPERPFRQQELARETGLDDGFTSRIVRRLEEDSLVQRLKDGTVSVPNPDVLLDAWAEVYSFDRHTILRGHVSARSSEEVVKRIATSFKQHKIQHAATGLAAAWQLTEFASFRLVSFFVAAAPSEAVLKAVGFREESKGANVWLVVPDDEGVFDGARVVGKVETVHPVQAYLDLGAHPERAADAARELRSRCLHWRAR